MELLEAFKSVQNKKIKLRIFGEGVLLEKAKTFAKKNNLNVNFYGKVSSKEVKKLMKTSTVFIHPSTGPDMFPRVWIEALSSNIP
ncbi:unnamed protein product, partial [marine sediment metagenome]